MRTGSIVFAAAILATSASAQERSSAGVPPRRGALNLLEMDAARVPIIVKANQLVDIYLRTEPGMEWKITYADNIKVDGVIAPTFSRIPTPWAPSMGGQPAPTAPVPPGTGTGRVAGLPDRLPQTAVRIQLSNMMGRWGLTLSYAKQPDRFGRTTPPIRTAAFKFQVTP